MRTLRFTSPHTPVECRRRLEQLVAKRFFQSTRGKGLFRYVARVILSSLKIDSETPAEICFRLYVGGRQVHIKARGCLQACGESTRVGVVFGLGILTKLAILGLIVFPVLVLAVAWIAAMGGHSPEKMLSILAVIPVFVSVYLVLLVWDYNVVVPTLSYLLYKALASEPGRLPAERFKSSTTAMWLDTLRPRN